MKIFSQINTSEEHMRHVKYLDLEKLAIAAHSWSLGYRFEEKPILLKHITNRQLPELLIWEKIFIYKNKEVAINFETPQFSDLYKLTDVDGGRQKALVTGQSNSSWGWGEHPPKALLHSSKFSEAKCLNNI